MVWVYYTKIPIYPIFYLLKGDYRVWGRAEGLRLWIWVGGFEVALGDFASNDSLRFAGILHRS